MELVGAWTRAEGGREREEREGKGREGEGGEGKGRGGREREGEGGREREGGKYSDKGHEFTKDMKIWQT